VQQFPGLRLKTELAVLIQITMAGQTLMLVGRQVLVLMHSQHTTANMRTKMVMAMAILPMDSNLMRVHFSLALLWKMCSDVWIQMVTDGLMQEMLYLMIQPST
jgi:hypothetical protein